MSEQDKPKKLTMKDVETKPQPQQPRYNPEHCRPFWWDDVRFSEEEWLGYTPGDQD